MSNHAVLQHCGPVQYSPQEQVPAERAEAEAILRRLPGVEGVGEGRDALGNPAWVVYLRDRWAAGQLPGRIGNRSVVPEISGEISTLPAAR